MERREQERRGIERRRPGDRLDVTRAEYENLVTQVVRNARAIQRIEAILERRAWLERRRDERRTVLGLATPV